MLSEPFGGPPATRVGQKLPPDSAIPQSSRAERFQSSARERTEDENHFLQGQANDHAPWPPIHRQPFKRRGKAAYRHVAGRCRISPSHEMKMVLFENCAVADSFQIPYVRTPFKAFHQAHVSVHTRIHARPPTAGVNGDTVPRCDHGLLHQPMKASRPSRRHRYRPVTCTTRKRIRHDSHPTTRLIEYVQHSMPVSWDGHTGNFM